ncbi:MAG: YgiQ family radical SAM protein [Clostridia bacterium]|nr:YgiQ family radical SAM protein [Clostridia bacterium]
MKHNTILSNGFLPVTQENMQELGIVVLDFVYVIGDAYVDHPSFGPAIISRVLQHAGYTVGILSQPDWHSCDDFTRLGKPRLGFLVSGGNIDPMVNHYTAAKKRRNTDLYSPGGEIGHRPDRATIVYCNRIREAYGREIPIIIGGIEASLRRFAHYDYWSDKVRRSILIDSGADLLTFGMGERQSVEIADLLQAGVPVKDIKHVAGTMYLESNQDLLPENCVVVPEYTVVSSDKRAYAEATMLQYQEQDAVRGKPVAQLDRDFYTVQNPPAPPLTTEELDAVYALPYMRTYHPMYEKQGGIPAIQEVRFSLTSCRGCYGACNFCALTFHQGRTVTSRSHESLIQEAELLTHEKGFAGYIHDVGGPTANFRAPSCKGQLLHGVCKRKQCLFPTPCKNLEVSHTDYLELLRKLRAVKGVKRVFVRSGIRYDYLIYDKDDSFFTELCKHHISGQLKVAPEHISDHVLKYMGKPSKEVYQRFSDKYYAINAHLGKKQYLVPYLMSSHPGSRLKDAIALAEFLRDNHLNPEQVQDFYPTPGSLSTCMYYTGLDPRDMKPVYVPKTYEEKQMQRALLQYKRPENYHLVYQALKTAGRLDLVGNSPKCLIPYQKGANSNGKNSERKAGFRKSQRRNETGSGKIDRRGNTTRSGGRYRGR